MANGRTFRLNNSAKKFASPSEGAAEGGYGGNSAAPERSAGAKRRRSIRVLRKMGSNFFKQTPPKLISIRIDRARARGAGLGRHFRQEIPRGFEFRQKHSRREAAVLQAKLGMCQRHMSRCIMRLQIVGVMQNLLSI